MTTTRRLSHRARWAVPAAAALVVAGAFAAPALVANADTDLPELTAEQLVYHVAAADPAALSGTVVYTARLGLPEIPLGEVAGADPVNLLGGSSTLRVWTDGQARSRVALLGATSEYSVVSDGPEAWTYASDDNEVVHYTVSAADRARLEAMKAEATTPPRAHGALPTPQEAGREALALAQRDSTISVEPPTTVAGRDAYRVVVEPKSDTTLVGRIVVAVDAETWTALRVQVWSADEPITPALEVGFTDVDFAKPSDAVLTFTPPPGAATRDVVVPLPTEQQLADARADADAKATAGLPDGVTVTGTGWDTVVELADVDVDALISADPQTVAEGYRKTFGSQGAQELYEQWVPAHGDGMVPDLDSAALYEALTTPVPQGRVLRSALLSALITDDGRVLVGAVPVDTLLALAQ